MATPARTLTPKMRRWMRENYRSSGVQVFAEMDDTNRRLEREREANRRALLGEQKEN